MYGCIYMYLHVYGCNYKCRMIYTHVIIVYGQERCSYTSAERCRIEYMGVPASPSEQLENLEEMFSCYCLRNTIHFGITGKSENVFSQYYIII